MKNKHLVLAVCLLFSLVWLGCNKAGKLNQQSEFKPPAGPITLALKWPLGERVEQEMDMTLSNQITIPGRPSMTQNMTMGQNYGLTVLQANPDSTHEIEMDFLGTRMTMKMGDKTIMAYDSDKKTDTTTTTPNPLADVFSKIVGSKIQYYLNASNGVDRVEGVDDLINRLSAGASPQTVAPLKGVFNEGYFKQMMSANQFLPTKPVQPGDTWPVQLEVPLGQMGTMIMHYDFTFSNWEEHGKRYCARMDFQGTIQSKPGEPPQMAGMTMNVQNGTTAGTAWFDPELGITIDTVMNQDLAMLMQLPKTKGGGPQTLSNQMHQAIEIKLVSVK